MDKHELSKSIYKCKEQLDGIKKGLRIDLIENKFEKIEDQMKNYDELSIESMKNLAIEQSQLNDVMFKINKCNTIVKDLEYINKLLQSPKDWNDGFFEEAKSLIDEFNKIYSDLEYGFLLSGEFDQKNCFIRITAGAGGADSCDWVDILGRMYTRWAYNNNMKHTMTDCLKSDGAGHRYLVYKIKGKYAYGMLKTETGIHRLVRNSPFDHQKRRHTSFAAVYVTPVVTAAQTKIDMSDLEITTCRSSGAGGQHVNTTDSKVKIKHIPTGIAVICQEERSQAKNKESAISMILSKLVLIDKKKQTEKLENISGEKEAISWGYQKRNYIFSPYKYIKDVVTGADTNRVDDFLDGEDVLNRFIKDGLIFNLKKIEECKYE